MKGGGEVASSLCHHIQPIPVLLQKAERPGTHTVSRQDINSPAPVQVVLHILEVQEYYVKYRHMLEQFGPKGGGPFPISCPETMQGDMVSDRRSHTQVNDTGGGLPQDLH